MILTTWPTSGSHNAGTREMAIAFAPTPAGGAAPDTIARHPGPRLLVLPALFDEANRLRRFTVEVMRRLATRGIASVLPDLPGCGESLAPLEAQSLPLWREAAAAAATHFAASHVLTIRASASLAPQGLPGWHYAPSAPASQLRSLLRARILARREAGVEETSEALLTQGLTQGLELAGHRLGPALLADLSAGSAAPTLPVITQNALAAPGLWLRAEPGEDAAQAARLATLIAHTLPQSAPTEASAAPSRRLAR